MTDQMKQKLTVIGHHTAFDNVKHSNKKTNGLIHVQKYERKNKYVKQQLITELQAPGSEPAHTECGGVKLV